MFLDLSKVETKSANKAQHQVLPEGEYDVVLSAAKIGPNKNNDGTNYTIEMVVTTPLQYQHRKIFHDFAIDNPNKQRQTIALEQLKSLLISAGFKKLQIETPAQLEHVRVNVVTVNREYNGKMYTNVKYFKPNKPLSTKTESSDGIPF